MTSATIQGYLSDSDKLRFSEVLSVILSSSIENPQPLPEESEVLENIEILFLEQYSKFGDEIFGWIDPEQVEEVKEEIVCDSIRDFFVSVKAFPRNESCKMLRYFFAEGVSE
jgi:phage/plasmid-associated DNA primase